MDFREERREYCCVEIPHDFPTACNNRPLFIQPLVCHPANLQVTAWKCKVSRHYFVSKGKNYPLNYETFLLTISTQYSIEIILTFTLETESCRVTYSFLTQTTCGVILTWWGVIFTYTVITIISCISYITYTVIWIWQVYTGAMWSTWFW